RGSGANIHPSSWGEHRRHRGCEETIRKISDELDRIYGWKSKRESPLLGKTNGFSLFVHCVLFAAAAVSLNLFKYLNSTSAILSAKENISISPRLLIRGFHMWSFQGL